MTIHKIVPRAKNIQYLVGILTAAPGCGCWVIAHMHTWDHRDSTLVASFELRSASQVIHIGRDYDCAYVIPVVHAY